MPKEEITYTIRNLSKTSHIKDIPNWSCNVSANDVLAHANNSYNRPNLTNILNKPRYAMLVFMVNDNGKFIEERYQVEPNLPDDQEEEK
jgi:hypothetical protein